MIITVLGRVATLILIVATLTLACWFVFSAATGATLITFRTGSMSPTMPQGALAVSLPVAAADIRVDDVVTVRRAGEELPVTHRVVEVRDPANATSLDLIPADARELVLKGDDNDTIDMLPYVVKDARRVVFAVPNLGSVLMLLQSPIGMGLLVITAGGFTTWAFWPKRTAESAETEEARTPHRTPIHAMERDA